MQESLEKQDTILTVEEAARYLRCGRRVVSRLAETGRLRCVDLGAPGYRLFRFRESDLDAFLESPYQPETFATAVEQDNQLVNMADRIATQNLRRRGLIK